MKSIILDHITDNRNNAIKTICDPRVDLTKLNAKQRQELTKGYLDCISGTGFMGKYLYGVNVRTSDNLEKIEPYFATSGNVDDFKKPDDDKSLPKFADMFKIREIFFYADFDKDSRPTKLEIHTLLFEAGIDKTRDEEEIKQEIAKWLQTGNNFFIVNTKGLLKVKSERIYMWLSSEDFFTGSQSDMQDYWSVEDNPYNKNNGQALSNILAISSDRDFLQKNIVSRRIDLLNFLILLKARNLFEQNLQRLRASEKSAKAAIMSRNMSHNLGSHVMAYLKQHLHSVQDMIKDNILDQVFQPGDTIESIMKNADAWLERINQKAEENARNATNLDAEGNPIKEIALPFLVGLGKFISYLQERQDFIATIATDYSPYFSTVNFKDFIYDELNPDLRYERHKDRSGMRPDNILLGNIAKSEGLARITRPTDGKEGSMSDIILKYNSFDGRPVIEGTPAYVDLEEMRGIEVSLPGGVVGRQAFFSVIENIIRNAAKHGKWGELAGDKKKNLELTFRFYPKVKSLGDGTCRIDSLPPKNDAYEYYVKDINGGWHLENEPDTFNFLKKYYAQSDGISDLNVLTCTDNMLFELVATPEMINKYQAEPDVLTALYSMSSGKSLAGIRKALCQRYIDKDGRMINENKGIKEMRISAAWMRSLEDSLAYNPFNELFKEQDKPNRFFNNKGEWIGKTPILMARAVKDGIGSVKTMIRVGGKDIEVDAFAYNLQLILCLMKPKRVCIITEKSFEKSFKDGLNEYSWNVFTQEEYHDKNNKNRSYEFILVDDRCYNEEVFTSIRFISHSRTYRLTKLKDSDLKTKVSALIDKTTIDETSIHDIEDRLYKNLADFKTGDAIRISDGRTFGKYSSDTNLPHSTMITITDGDPTENKKTGGKQMCKFVYTKHLETDNEFATFMNTNPTPEIDFFAPTNATNPGLITFAEGITGNNSTDRLIRNEQLTNKWVFANLHAMKQKIAIFDERLFFKAFRVEEMDLLNRQNNVDPFVSVTSSNFKQIYNQEQGNLPKEYIAKREAGIDKDVLVKELNDILFKRYEESSRTRMGADKGGLLFAMKGVYIFNIIKSTNHLDIYGYAGHTIDGVLHRSYVDKVGSIALDDTGKINFTISDCFLRKFDRISIHQGLLDKIYETFGIKSDAQAKHDVTLAIYKQLSSSQKCYNYDDKIAGKDIHGYFLPHLMIHSGRSKPSMADMPQHQPFIQYAAIEHAVLDCKYSLVELLDFARYEQYEED